MNTLRWAWGMIWNPPLVWTDGNTGEFSHTEKVKRFRGSFTRWDLRPMWFHTALTTRPGCGCRKRFGLWRTMICAEHSGWDF